MKNEPLGGTPHYGMEDREFLDRNPVQPDLLPTKLNLLRWKLSQKAKQKILITTRGKKERRRNQMVSFQTKEFVSLRIFGKRSFRG